MYCILCNNHKVVHYFKDKKRDYFQCNRCNLVFIHPNQRLKPEKEKIRYELHQNNPKDEGYINFLRRMYDPIIERVPQNRIGLDYGSGPTPVLSEMFKESGHKVNIYDCYYANNKSVLKLQYDFITATEVIEHIYSPDIELNNLWRILKPSGYLGIMTKLLKSKIQFKDWYYKEDITHIAFYSINTFKWIEKKLKALLTVVDEDIVLFRKI